MIGTSTVLFVVLCLGSVNSQYDVIFFDYALPPPSPLHLMVDATNQLAYNVLFTHGLTNNNNYAFSPCGLASVLVAVYEGCVGRSAVQIYNTLQLPADRHLTRVGFRDIHRRLRSYFFLEDNILNGLHFNRDSVIIRVEYLTILRFYGYDAGTGLVPPMTKVTTTASPNTTDATPVTTLVMESDSVTTIVPEMTTAKQPDQTTMPPTTIPITMIPTTTIPTTTIPPTTIAPTTIPSTTIPPTTIPTTTTSSTTPKSETTIKMMTTTEMAALQNDSPTETTSQNPATQETEPPATSGSKETSTESVVMSTIPSATEMTTLEIATEDSTMTPTTVTDSPSTQTAAKLTERTTFTPITRIPVRKIPAIDKASRSRRSAQYEIHNYDPALFLTQLNQFPSFNPIGAVQSPILEDHSFADLAPKFVPPTGRFDENSEIIIQKLFYLTPFESINIPYKLYNSTLKYTYINKIKSTVLELPLDSDNYNLLLISPDFDFGMEALLTSLQSGYAPSIRDIKKRLKSAWVRAIVPNFELKGNVVLTGVLQNMGITDIFEPTRANFSPMTEEEGVYARNIEQAINVKIRINAVDQLKRIYYRTPIDIMFNRPFLFFIVDTDLDLVVMTGRILNPLNSRIL